MRRLLSLTLASVFISLLMPAAAKAQYAPANRAVFSCPSQTSCPGTDYVTFNSFVNNPSYGDERAFLKAKNSNSSNPGFTNGTVDINSDAVLIQAYVHNDADPTHADSTAHDTSVKFILPNGFASNQTVTSEITASNANPVTISDTNGFSAPKPFSLVFDNSAPVYLAKRTNNGKGDYINSPVNTVSVNGNVVTVSFGDWLGGYVNHGLVTIRAKVNYQTVQPAVQTSSAVLVCSSMSVTPIDHNRATVTTVHGVQNATVTGYKYTVTNSSGTVVDTQKTSNTYNFNQSTPSTYTVTAIVNTDKGDSPVTSNCTHQIVVSAQPTTLSASTSTALPNTGAGDVIGLFSGASVLGTAGHMVYSRRRR